ncbi:MAG: DUF3592 domain-containing protein, partial [Planctomycetales bacterium]|nr:DUF3592 domain-containing protein [Planctomycetales bacterium]
MASLFVAFILGGFGIFGWGMHAQLIPQWRANHSFVAAECIVLKSRVATDAVEEAATHWPEVLIQYTVDGESHTAWTYDIARTGSRDEASALAATAAFTAGQSYTCWYDPADPNVAVLVRGYTWSSIWLVALPTLFVAVGGAGLAYTLIPTGKSSERRAVLRDVRVPERLLTQESARDAYPTIPDVHPLIDSPGTTLAYRLPVESTEAWSMAALSVLTIVTNLAAATLVWISRGRGSTTAPDWLFVGVAAACALAGLAALYRWVQRLVVHSAVGPTTVEISALPVYPGMVYEMLVSQAGRLTVRSYCVELVCDEEATYHQGTDSRTETREVFCRELLRVSNVEVGPNAPLDRRVRLTIPDQAVHSFAAPHNSINWHVRVSAEVERWPS